MAACREAGGGASVEAVRHKRRLHFVFNLFVDKLLRCCTLKLMSKILSKSIEGFVMRIRGKVYWGWANPDLHFRNHDERLDCGTLINIQVRVSTQGVTQVFLGVYGDKGLMMLEEAYDDCKGLTMTAAMTWALERAYAWVSDAGGQKPSSS